MKKRPPELESPARRESGPESDANREWMEAVRDVKPMAPDRRHSRRRPAASPTAAPAPAMAQRRKLSIGSDQQRRAWRRKLRRGAFPVEEELDLHGLNQQEALHELKVFLEECTELGLSCVRVIHGKGRLTAGRPSVLRRRLPEWLARQAEVVEFAQAPFSLGGEGATLVLLRAALKRSRRD